MLWGNNALLGSDLHDLRACLHLVYISQSMYVSSTGKQASWVEHPLMRILWSLLFENHIIYAERVRAPGAERVRMLRESGHWESPGAERVPALREWVLRRWESLDARMDAKRVRVQESPDAERVQTLRESGHWWESPEAEIVRKLRESRSWESPESGRWDAERVWALREFGHWEDPGTARCLIFT